MAKISSPRPSHGGQRAQRAGDAAWPWLGLGWQTCGELPSFGVCFSKAGCALSFTPRPTIPEQRVPGRRSHLGCQDKRVSLCTLQLIPGLSPWLPPAADVEPLAVSRSLRRPGEPGTFLAVVGSGRPASPLAACVTGAAASLPSLFPLRRRPPAFSPSSMSGNSQNSRAPAAPTPAQGSPRCLSGLLTSR